MSPQALFAHVAVNSWVGRSATEAAEAIAPMVEAAAAGPPGKFTQGGFWGG